MLSKMLPESKGIKTSEFWVGLLAAPIVTLLVAVMSSLGIEVEPTMVASLVTPALAFIFGRIIFKKKEQEIEREKITLEAATPPS